MLRVTNKYMSCSLHSQSTHRVVHVAHECSEAPRNEAHKTIKG